MKSKKGFTLIELLAVIVILAIIALIASPIIINIINKSNMRIAINSTYGYIKAIEYELMMAEINEDDYDENKEYFYDEIKVNVKGKIPTGGVYKLEKTVVSKGSFCVNGYIVNYDKSKNATVSGEKCDDESFEFDNVLTLSSTSGKYTYPTSGTFTITENLSGGKLSCASSDEDVAICSISGTEVTVTPGTKSGVATLTITSSATTNYREAKVAYVATTESGVLASVTANGYSGIYDGEEHGISVISSGATIKYGTSSDSYTLTSSPTYTNAGTYTVYYQVSKDGYKTVTGSKQVVISKAANTLTLSASSGTYTYPTSGTFTVLENTSNGTLSCSSSNTNVATCSISGTKVTVTPGKIAGNTTLTIKSESTTNYSESQKSYNVTVVAIASNTVDGVTTNYTSLKAALLSSTAGTTTLLKNTAEDIATGNIVINKTLNLNSKTNNGYIWLNNNSATLVINGPGTLTESSDRVIINDGNMTINNVTMNATTNFNESIKNNSLGIIRLNNSRITSNSTNCAIDNDNSVYGSVRLINASFGGTNYKLCGYITMLSSFGVGEVEAQIFGLSATDNVRCPTWSDANDQDDIEWPEANYWNSTTGVGSYKYCRLNKSAHNNETGVYHTHLYRYDSNWANPIFIDEFRYEME